jgi:ABC-type Mn2+/Zn2+ transport system ATPase subunit
MMNSAITVENLNHAFDGRPVLEGVGFEVARGQFFIIIGPNGSGKTTLLKLLVGLLPLKSGHIDIMSRNISRYTARDLARQIAYVPQNVPVEFPFSVTQVVLMGRSPHLGLLGFEGEADLKMAQTGHGHHRRGSIWPIAGWTSFPAESSSVSSLPGPFASNPRFCCWTNPPPPWISPTRCVSWI